MKTLLATAFAVCLLAISMREPLAAQDSQQPAQRSVEPRAKLEGIPKEGKSATPSTPEKVQTNEVDRLRVENELLRKENQELRKLLANGAPPTTPIASPARVNPSPAPTTVVEPATPTGKPQAVSPLGSKWALSSTGKRHNNSCRYFNSGKPCGATEGVACKICGG